MRELGSKSAKSRFHKCEQCRCKYKSERWLKIHTLTHDGNGEDSQVVDTTASNHKNRTYKKSKASNKTRSRRRQESILRYPCMFCNFGTPSRSHAEHHMEVRHNARYKTNLKLIRAHADELEVQHHQMLLACEIEETLVIEAKLSLENRGETFVPKNAKFGIENPTDILCDKCGFTFASADSIHNCQGGMSPSASSPILSGNNYRKVNSNDSFSSEYHHHEELVPCTRNKDEAPLDLSYTSRQSQSEQATSSQGQTGSTENSCPVMVHTCFGSSVPTSTSNTKSDDQPVIFTFQDLLILDQTLSPYYL